MCVVGGAVLTNDDILQPNSDILEIWLQEDDHMQFRTVGNFSLWGMGQLLLNEQIFLIGGYTSTSALSEHFHIIDPDTYIVSQGLEGPKGLVRACNFPNKNSGLVIVGESGHVKH